MGFRVCAYLRFIMVYKFQGTCVSLWVMHFARPAQSMSFFSNFDDLMAAASAFQVKEVLSIRIPEHNSRMPLWLWWTCVSKSPKNWHSRAGVGGFRKKPCETHSSSRSPSAKV